MRHGIGKDYAYFRISIAPMAIGAVQRDYVNFFRMKEQQRRLKLPGH